MSIFWQTLDNQSQDNVEQSIVLLYRMRWVAIIGQILFSLVAHLAYGFILPFVWMLAIICFELVFQAATAYRIFNRERFPQIELFLHLLIDALFLTGIVFLTGGTNNPFTYLLLIPVGLGNFMLRPKQLIVLTLIICVLYSFLHINYVPLNVEPRAGQELFNLHMVGMWVNFEITAFILALFGLAARGVFVAQQQKIQLLREKQMKDEQLLSLGIISANAAHELSTPLSTIAIIADDLSHNNSIAKDIHEDISMMRSEIDRCKLIIDQLSHRSRDSREQILNTEEHDNMKPVADEISRLVDTWSVIRPEITVDLDIDNQLQTTKHLLDITVEQAISNLLNNAADASVDNGQNQIEVSAFTEPDELVITIQDYGSGIPESLLKQLGNQILDSNKPTGLGWGHFLSNASIERVGGAVNIQDNDLGTLTRISIPLIKNERI